MHSVVVGAWQSSIRACQRKRECLFLSNLHSHATTSFSGTGKKPDPLLPPVLFRPALVFSREPSDGPPGVPPLPGARPVPTLRRGVRELTPLRVLLLVEEASERGVSTSAMGYLCVFSGRCQTWARQGEHCTNRRACGDTASTARTGHT